MTTAALLLPVGRITLLNNDQLGLLKFHSKIDWDNNNNSHHTHNNLIKTKLIHPTFNVYLTLNDIF